MKKFAIAIAACWLLAGSLSAADMPGSCVTVYAPPNWAGCGTCVGVDESGKSLVVTNNHIFSDRHDPRGGFIDTIYPVNCKVAVGANLSNKKLDAVAVAGDRTADLVLVVVDARLPVSELADDVPPAKSVVWRFGHGTGAVKTRVSGTASPFAEPRFGFRAEGNSESGDSGSAYFNESWQVVAVHCGKDEGYPRGTPVSAVRAFVAKHRPKAKFAPAVKDAPKPKDAPKGGIAGKGLCICGDNCKCPADSCPGKCPVVKAPAVIQYRYEYAGTDRWGRRVWRLVPAGQVPQAMPGCPNGKCPLQK